MPEAKRVRGGYVNDRTAVMGACRAASDNLQHMDPLSRSVGRDPPERQDIRAAPRNQKREN